MPTLRTDVGTVDSLRVHREAGFDPPDVETPVHVVVGLDRSRGTFYGFPLQHNQEGAVHREWLETLRAAFTHRGMVTIEYEDTGGDHHPIRRIEQVLRPPGVPRNFSGSHHEGRTIDLVWDSVRDAQEYEFSYNGRVDSGLPQPGPIRHKGTVTTRGTSYRFRARRGHFAYTFQIRSIGHASVSPWSREVRVVRSETDDDQNGEPEEREITYTGRLEPDIPHEGNVLYLSVVNPGRPARLISVHVIGSGLTPYVVQFLRPGSGRTDCGTHTGVFIEPGSTLEGSDLNTLYGEDEPATPVALIGCKLIRGDAPRRIHPIPVNITYRR